MKTPESKNATTAILVIHGIGQQNPFDTLNRLNIKANIDPDCEKLIKKIKGLITFGSPLDKVAFFFTEHAKKDQYVRRQIMEQLHSFKAKKFKDINNGNGGFAVGNSIEPKLDGLPWTNFYSAGDPISGHLDFYNVDRNVELDLHQRWGVAHIGDWNHEKFYEDIIKNYLPLQPGRG